MKKRRLIPATILSVLILTIAFLYTPDLPLAQLKAKYANADSRFVEINGMQVHYRVEGQGEPLVLIHGTGSVLQSWDGWAGLLRSRYQIIRMDIPAFGLTGPRADGDYSDSMYVDFIDQFVRKVGVDSFYLGGNSLGGLIAWKYAVAHPEKVKKLILVDPAGWHEVKKAKGSLVFTLAREYPAFTKLISKIGTRYLIAKTLREVYYDDSKITEKMKTTYIELNRRAGNRQAFIDRMQYVTTTSNEDDLKKITAPTLVLWGKDDVLIDVREAEHFKTIPSTKFVFYDQMGHVPQEEIPEQSAADALHFLQDRQLVDNVLY